MTLHRICLLAALSAFGVARFFVGATAHAAIIGINPAASTMSVTFDDTTSSNSSSVPGTTVATAFVGPSGGGPQVFLSLTLPTTVDPVTLDTASTLVLAIATPTSYGVFLNSTQLTQQTGNLGFAEMVVQFNVQYLMDAAGLGPQIIAIPSVTLNGTVQTGGLSSFRGLIQFTSGSLGAINHVDYLYTNSTPGSFATTLGGSLTGPSVIALPAFDTLTLSGFYTLKVDPASIAVEIVPEPTTGMLILLSIPLLCQRRRRGL